jgi:hypothetical protein
MILKLNVNTTRNTSQVPKIEDDFLVAGGVKLIDRESNSSVLIRQQV